MMLSRRSAMLTLLAIPLAAEAAEEHQTDLGAPASLGPQALGVDPRIPPTANHQQIELGKAIGRDLVCLCGDCPKRLITDCECGWAVQNQNAILAAVVKGMSRQDIFQAYVRAYGDQVRAQIPPCSENPLGCTAFILPYVAGVLGLFAVFVVGMRLRRSQPATQAAPTPAFQAPQSDDAELQLKRELEDLD